jgi:hypothetical protein
MTTTREFEELTLNGSNYPTWASDIKIALAARKISSTIQEPQQGAVVTDHQNYFALALFLFYIHKDLKAEYVMIENAWELWVALKERYDQQNKLIWPEANHEWNHLRLQDFKIVADYNHAVHRICSRLKLCEKEPTDADKIEKTLSTMHPSDRVIQQQYGAHGYTVYSKLIHTLSQAKKHDGLLVKNHQKHLVGSAPLPEVHNVQKNNRNKQKFQRRDPRNKFNKRKFNKGNKPHFDNKKKDNAKPKNDKKCHRCRDYSHFAKACKTPKHLVALYQKSLKETKPTEEKRYETHFYLVSENKEVGCSREAPIKKNNTTTKDLPSMDNMLIDFESGDIFGDLE